MTALERVRAVLDRMTFPPMCHVTAYPAGNDDDDPRIVVHLRADVPNVYPPHEVSTLNRATTFLAAVVNGLADAHLDSIIGNAVLWLHFDAARHEIRERVRLDGIPVDDPHRNDRRARA